MTGIKRVAGLGLVVLGAGAFAVPVGSTLAGQAPVVLVAETGCGDGGQAFIEWTLTSTYGQPWTVTDANPAGWSPSESTAVADGGSRTLTVAGTSGELLSVSGNIVPAGEELIPFSGEATFPACVAPTTEGPATTAASTTAGASTTAAATTQAPTTTSSVGTTAATTTDDAVVPPSPPPEIIEEGCELWGLIEGPDGECVEPPPTETSPPTRLPATGSGESLTMTLAAMALLAGGGGLIMLARRAGTGV